MYLNLAFDDDTSNQMKMRELTLREKQAIWMLKKSRKSFRAIAKQRAWRNQEFGKPPATNNYLIGWENNSSWWQTNKKAVKMNPKGCVCKNHQHLHLCILPTLLSNPFRLYILIMYIYFSTTSRKLGWCSDNLLSSGDFDTELQMLHNKMQTSDQHQK